MRVIIHEPYSKYQASIKKFTTLDNFFESKFYILNTN